MKTVAVGILVILISNLAFAESSRSLRMTALVPGDSPVPIPAPPAGSFPVSNRFKFPAGKALWDKSLLPSEQNLIGDWIEIGYADVSPYFAGEKNFYDENGHQRDDGTISTLRWSYQKDPLTGHDLFSAEFLHFGRANQGPYEASVDPSSNSAVASHFAYNGHELGKSYFRLNCRVMANDGDRLICAMTLKVDPSEKDTLITEQQAFDNVLGGIELFKRVRK